MKALFCTDGSEISFNAIKNFNYYSKEIVIDILCVIDWHFYPMYMDNPIHDYQNTYEDMADKILDFAESEIEKYNNIVRLKLKTYGSAAEEILKQIQKDEYDLVIMGSHGKKGIQNWIGSVSNEVVNSSKTNMFISKAITQNEKILFTSDGSEKSFQAIKNSLKILDLSNKEVYFTYVEKDLNNLPIELKLNKQWLEEIMETQELNTKKILKNIKEIFDDANIKISKQITMIGDPAKKIIELNKEIEFDLIITGSNSKNKIEKFLLGSVSKRILENIKSSVLIMTNNNHSTGQAG